MQSFKAIAAVRRSLPSILFSPRYKTISSAPNIAECEDLQNQVLVEGKANSRTAILNRPHALNALTTSMGARLNKLYESWEENTDIGFVVMKWQSVLCRWRCCCTLSSSQRRESGRLQELFQDII